MFSKILIANRGEIACRVIRTARRLGIRTVGQLAELEAATADLREANERLRELDRMKDDFISTVTHELRTPLTSIRAFSEMLHEDPELDLADRHQGICGQDQRKRRPVPRRASVRR